MYHEIKSLLQTSLLLLIVLTLLTGLVYPILVTGIAQLLLPQQANGSLVTVQGTRMGSNLIGQYFTGPRYFWGRLSATTPYPYNAAASSASNLGPTNPALIQAVAAQVKMLRVADPQHAAVIPVDLVTHSGSGLDPDISPAAAFYQAARVAKARGLSVDQVNTVVRTLIQPRQWHVFGEPRVNVLQLNLALDALSALRN